MFKVLARALAVAAVAAGAVALYAAPAQATGDCPTNKFCFYRNANYSDRLAVESNCGQNDLPAGAWDRTTSFVDHRSTGFFVEVGSYLVAPDIQGLWVSFPGDHYANVDNIPNRPYAYNDKADTYLRDC